MSLRLCLLVLALATAVVAVACASAPPLTTTTSSTTTTTTTTTTTAAAPTSSTTYYAGTVAVTSPDGATPFGPPTATLVARAIDVATGTITESTIDDGKRRLTTLKRRGDTTVFDATDDANSFTGTVTFAGTPWTFTGWTYDIAMNDKSGTIAGTATISDTMIVTEKFFSSPDGQRRARIVDTLRVVDKAAYDAALPTLLKP